MKMIRLKQTRGNHALEKLVSFLLFFGNNPSCLLHSEAEQAKQAPAKKRGRQKAPEPPGTSVSCIHHVACLQQIEHSVVSSTTDLCIFAVYV